MLITIFLTYLKYKEDTQEVYARRTSGKRGREQHLIDYVVASKATLLI